MRIKTIGLCLTVISMLMAGLVSQPAAEAQQSTQKQRVVSISENHTKSVMAAVKEDGRLYVRGALRPGLDVLTDWHGFVRLGSASDWVSVDIVLTDKNNVYLAAIKENGALYTRSGSLPAWDARSWTWDPWVKHGQSSWSTTAAPAIDMKGSTNFGSVMLAAVKADGRLYTREFLLAQIQDGTTEGEWQGFVRHGATGWSMVDISMTGPSNPTLYAVWLIATKTDGRLYTRTRPETSTTWDGFIRQGASDWDPSTPPAIDSDRNRKTVFAAIKDDGRLYTRRHWAGDWDGFIRHGAADWAAVNIESDGRDEIIVAVKTNGAMYTRLFGVRFPEEQFFEPWIKHGASNWSLTQPSIANSEYNSDRLTIAAVKDGGALYTRSSNFRGTSLLGFVKQGASTWADG